MGTGKEYDNHNEPWKNIILIDQKETSYHAQLKD